jgi:decaprenyl-phosphate phosphoribosyltransferase
MSSELLERPARSLLTLPDVRVLRGGVTLLEAMRPRQWTKQVFVGAAPIVGGVLLQWSAWAHLGLAVIAFSLAASAGYLHNDLGDIAEDRLHPRKRFRPIASGALPVPIARAASLGLFGAGIAVAAISSWQLSTVVAAYALLTTTYTSYLKHIPTVDVVAVAMCFTVRALGGAVAVDVPVTDWFFVVVTAASLFLVIGKRESELRSITEAGAGTPLSRRTLSKYSARYLRLLRRAAFSAMVVGYAGWAITRQEGAGWHSPYFAASVLPFAVTVIRYAVRVDHGEGEEPDEIIREDRPLLLAGVLTAVLVALGTYL